MVDGPKVDGDHYRWIDGIECIDVVENMDFIIGNIIKYAWRAGRKPGAAKIDDLRKCLWYARRAVEREEEKAIIERDRDKGSGR